MQKQKIHRTRTKLISITMIIIIINTLIYALISPKPTYAVTQTRNTDANNIYNIDGNLYPGYATLLQNLKSSHPNWTFTLLYTDLEWNEVLIGETIANHSRSLVQGKTGEWLCTYPSCDGIPHDGATWFGASQTAVAYFMDPRNFLTEDRIFQFETLSYMPAVHTEAGVEAVLRGSFMYNTRICDYYGNIAYGERTFAQVIMDAAQQANVSPYHIASRIRQEVGVNGSGSTTGTVSGYEGYFNFYNIGAYASADPVINGLIYAQSASVNWNTPEKSIIGGAKWIANSYIARGQDSLYLQRWDVDNQYDGLYSHLYQTNIEAPTSESSSIYSSYKSIFNNDLTGTSFNFVIPMYKNIPTTLSRYPSSSTYVAQDAQIIDQNGIGVYIRQTPAGIPIGLYYNGYSFIRMELKSAKESGTTWDKVMLADGTIGYIATQFVIETTATQGLSKNAYINSSAELLNGPRTTANGTTAFRTLFQGQPVTIVEDGKYTFDGYVWCRVKLGDGTSGYIQKNYVTEGTYGEQVTITCDTELALRSTPDGNIIKWIYPGEVVNRIEMATEQVGGYYRDKVITADGIVGYMARERYNPYALWLTPVGGSTNTNKIEVSESDGTVKAIPTATLADIQQNYPEATLVSGTENLGTGSIIKIGEIEYTIIKLGDVNGDGKMNSGDLLAIQKDLLKVKLITNEVVSKAADSNQDGKINSGDLLKVQKHLLQVTYITL